MSTKPTNLPDPTTEAVALWLKQLDRELLHDAGWLHVNRELHGIAKAARPFIHKEYSTEEQEAVFDGMTLALLTMLRFHDIERLAELFKDLPATTETSELQGSPTIEATNAPE